MNKTFIAALGFTVATSAFAAEVDRDQAQAWLQAAEAEMEASRTFFAGRGHVTDAEIGAHSRRVQAVARAGLDLFPVDSSEWMHCRGAATYLYPLWWDGYLAARFARAKAAESIKSNRQELTTHIRTCKKSMAQMRKPAVTAETRGDYKIIKRQDISVRFDAQTRNYRMSYSIVVPISASDESIKAAMRDVIEREQKRNRDIDAIAVFTYFSATMADSGALARAEWAPKGEWAAVTPRIARTNDRSSYRVKYALFEELRRQRFALTPPTNTTTPNTYLSDGR